MGCMEQRLHSLARTSLCCLCQHLERCKGVQDAHSVRVCIPGVFGSGRWGPAWKRCRSSRVTRSVTAPPALSGTACRRATSSNTTGSAPAGRPSRAASASHAAVRKAVACWDRA